MNDTKDAAKVLIIDDEESSLRLMKMILEKEQFEVIQAIDGNEGMRLFHLHQPVMVITDIFMPDKEGLEIIQEVKTANPATKVIAVTGYPNTRVDYLEIAKTFGADAVFEKPLSAKEFTQEIKVILSGK